MCQKFTVVGIKEITKDDRKLTRPRWRRLKTLPLVLNGIAEVTVLKGHQQHHGKENAEQLRCKYTALLRAM